MGVGSFGLGEYDELYHRRPLLTAASLTRAVGELLLASSRNQGILRPAGWSLGLLPSSSMTKKDCLLQTYFSQIICL